jgi:hypothetical protein
MLRCYVGIRCYFVFSVAVGVLCQTAALAETIVKVDHQSTRQATSAFNFPNIASPVQGDAGTRGAWSIVSGTADPASASLQKLNDGFVPRIADQPSENFFFAPATEGGRLLLDLKSPVDIKQIRSYSWHVRERAAQVYALFGSDENNSDEFELKPESGTDPTTCGWTKIASVDTRRAANGTDGGQYAVDISSTDNVLGRFRYLLFEVKSTQPGGRFSNTFFSEIDVLDAASVVTPATVTPVVGIESYVIEEGGYEFQIDTSDCPDLTTWTQKEVVPVVRQWYPQIVKLLASDGYAAPQKFTLQFSVKTDGVAATGGTDVFCSADWFRRNLRGEAKGAIVHELVHVVQQYGMARRTNRNATPTPSWVVEGIADYVRWHLYEPATARGGIGGRSPANLRYDASYRDTAAFFDWVVDNEAPELIAKLNTAARTGTYSDAFWKEATGKTANELSAAWHDAIEQPAAQLQPAVQ